MGKDRRRGIQYNTLGGDNQGIHIEPNEGISGGVSIK